MAQCLVEGCPNPARTGSSRWCHVHYMRMRRYGAVEVPERALVVHPCSMDGCEKPAVAHGLCGAHYRHYRKTQTPPCLVEGCERPVTAKGLCETHYNRVRRLGSTDLPVHTPQPCAVEGCQRVARAKGLCLLHYNRQRLHGTTEPVRLTTEDRFWQKVRMSDGCWEWLGARLPKGYGKFQRVLAHVFAYELSYGPVPAGLEIDHTCEQPWCVNPAHLEVVTHTENLRRGRERRTQHG